MFSKFNIPVTIIDAVDAREFSDDELKKISCLPTHKSKKKQRWLRAGEIGCALSHKEFYKIVANQDIKYAMILEDDAFFVRDIIKEGILEEQVLDIIQQQTRFDILLLSTCKVDISELKK
ncbi:glycosyltransferase family 25 protein [Campylobacter sp. 9BO]|uniref:glycosyltransferase family 25 protein n=1 Tax=Campylobacter sp. 9BO TaxID=3424759 RepID=UPI003D330EA7